MTRETKVGLLVGMGVILLIGIIVSDQLSSIQRQDAADLTEFAGDTQDSIAPMGTAEPHFDTAIDARADVLTPPGSTVRNEVPPPAADDVPAEFAAPPIDPQRQARSESVLEQIAMRTDTLRPAPPIDPELVARTTTETIIPLRDDSVPAITLDTPVEYEVAERPSIPTASTLTSTTTAKGATHTVEEGDSLYRIAEKYLGDGNDWKKIADANPGKVGKDGQVQAGVELTIPGKTVAKPADNKPEPSTRPQTKPSKTYTVRSGDSLYSIAAAQMGSGGKWDELYQANRDQLKDPDNVREGMTLKIPG